jgi:hypothetical protein
MANSNKKFYTDVQIKSDIIIDNATAGNVPVFDGSKKIKSSAVTSTELDYLQNVRSNIQDQIDLEESNRIGADQVLQDEIDAIEAQIAALPDPMEYKGIWNASTNTPALTDGTGDNGDVWYVGTAGTQFSPAINFQVGDKAVYNGATGKYEKWDTTEAVSSVNGQTGVVVLSTDQITEGNTNLYFNDELAQDAVGAALINTDTVSLSYDDANNQISATVQTQMSITSDGDGIKLDGDSSVPGNTKYYGTNSSGVKGFYDIPAVGSSGDIQETSFSFANNQVSAANVTGLAFANGTVRSFSAIVSVYVDASTDLFEQFELNGIQRGTDWAMSIESQGDDSGILFSISNSGQVQYTSANATGFASGVMKFRAWSTSV